MNQFVSSRKNGETLSEAGQCFIDAGMSPDYPEYIHRRFKRSLPRLALIFEDQAPIPAFYAEAIHVLAGKDSLQPLSAVNRLCQSRGYNPLFFSRNNILILKDYIPQRQFSHNSPSRPPP